MSIWVVTAALASGAIGHCAGVESHHLAKLSNASAKPFAWLSEPAAKLCRGSTAPSSTSARTFCGKSWAYVAPSRVP